MAASYFQHSMSFAFHYLKALIPHQTTLNTLARNHTILEPAKRWGAFHGLFGLGSNELFLVSVGDTTCVHSTLEEIEELERVRSINLEPTVRPTDERPLTKEGLYVFRFFGVQSRDIDRIAQLSKEAWTYFETSEDYQAVPQALFCETDRSKERGLMLLVTWYDGLNSWQTSRRPAPEASKNFRERASLTLFTKPFATRLIK